MTCSEQELAALRTVAIEAQRAFDAICYKCEHRMHNFRNDNGTWCALSDPARCPHSRFRDALKALDDAE